MTTLTSAPIGSTGQSLDGVAVNGGLFRESVVIGDSTDGNAFATVDPIVGLTVNVASTVPQSINVSTSVTVTTFPNALGQATMVSSVPVTLASDQSPVTINIASSIPLNISTMPALAVGSIGISSFATAISVSSIPSVGVSSFGTAIAVSTIPAVGVSSVTAGTFPGLNISTFSAGSIGVSSVASHNVTISSGIGISSFGTAIAISSIPAVGVSSFATAIAVSTIPAVGVSSVTAATFPGLNISTFSAGSIGVSSLGTAISISSIPAVGVSSMVAIGVSSHVAIGVSSVPITQVTQTATSVGGGLSVSLLKQNLATTNSTVAKAAPGQVYGWNISNTSTQCYFRVFNASSAVQISTAAQILQIALTASSAVSQSLQNPITFSTGIYYALTSLQAAGDNTAIAASTVTINLYYA